MPRLPGTCLGRMYFLVGCRSANNLFGKSRLRVKARRRIFPSPPTSLPGSDWIRQRPGPQSSRSPPDLAPLRRSIFTHLSSIARRPAVSSQGSSPRLGKARECLAQRKRLEGRVSGGLLLLRRPDAPARSEPGRDARVGRLRRSRPGFRPVDVLHDSTERLCRVGREYPPPITS